MKEFLNVAIEAAREAGGFLLENFGQTKKIERKVDQSLVTEIDRESERIITKILRSSFPNHGIVGEEGASRESSGEDGYLWVVDPLDGTHNFVKGIGMCGVSIGLIRGEEFIAGVINLPSYGELYWAEKGAGAFKNGERIGVSAVNELRDCTVSYDSGMRSGADRKIDVLKKLAPEVLNVRMFGASVRNLTYLAEGKVDAVIEFDDKIWDFTGGAVIVLEAGGRITDHSGRPFSPQNNCYLASNGPIHDSLLEMFSGLEC